MGVSCELETVIVVSCRGRVFRSEAESVVEIGLRRAVLTWFCMCSEVSPKLVIVCVSVLFAMSVVSVSCSVLSFVVLVTFLWVEWREILVMGVCCCSVALVRNLLSCSSVSGGMSLAFGKLCVYVGKLKSGCGCIYIYSTRS